MNAKRKKLNSSYLTIGLFFIAAALMLFSAVGSSRAALTYYSETYGAEVSMLDIGVTLKENGENISWRDYTGSGDIWREYTGVLVANLTGTNAQGVKNPLQLNHTYEEQLGVQNTGTIDEYVRVSIYRYFVQNGVKQTTLSPSLIDLHLVNGNMWLEDETARTEERTVLYYQGILPAGELSELFADTLTIRESDGLREGMRAKVTTKTTQVTGEDGKTRTTIETTYDYEGVQFVLQVDVDAVQTHNAEDAIRSAWGVEMSRVFPNL